jgi:hypothetical protein
MDQQDSSSAVERVFEAMVERRYIVQVAPLDLTKASPPPDRSGNSSNNAATLPKKTACNIAWYQSVSS